MKQGDKVKIYVEPGCPGEFMSHGMAPLVRDKVGIVADVVEGKGIPSDHYYWVFVPDFGHHSWFAGNELTPLKDTEASQ